MRNLPNEASDAELVPLDDPDAFAIVYDRHVGEIFVRASARVGEHAADLTAEVFARAWRDRKRLRDQAGGCRFPEVGYQMAAREKSGAMVSVEC